MDDRIKTSEWYREAVRRRDAARSADKVAQEAAIRTREALWVADATVEDCERAAMHAIRGDAPLIMDGKPWAPPWVKEGDDAR